MKRLLVLTCLLVSFATVAFAQDNALNLAVNGKNQETNITGWVLVDLLSEDPAALMLVGKHYSVLNKKSWVEPLVGTVLSREEYVPALGGYFVWDKPWMSMWLEVVLTDPLNAPGLGYATLGMWSFPLRHIALPGFEILSHPGFVGYGLNATIPLGDNFSLVGHYREGGVMSVDMFLSF